MVEIRSANVADARALEQIQRQALAESSPQLLEKALDGVLGLRVGVTAEVPATEVVLGYALFLEGRATARLLELAVRPNRQREGIGSSLLVNLCERLATAEHEELRVTARCTDHRARDFYTSHGFRTRERLPEYFEEADGVLLVRKLSD